MCTPSSPLFHLSTPRLRLILNEPAGKIAQVVVVQTVDLIVRAWEDNTNPDEVINVVSRPLKVFTIPRT